MERTLCLDLIRSGVQDDGMGRSVGACFRCVLGGGRAYIRISDHIKSKGTNPLNKTLKWAVAQEFSTRGGCNRKAKKRLLQA